MIAPSIESSLKGQKWINVAKTLAIAGLMLLLFYLLGRELLGGVGSIAVLLGTTLLAIQIFRDPGTIRGVVPLSPRNAPWLYDITQLLAARAGLSRAPALFYVPTPLPNAFTFGRRDDARIFVTQGLLDRLDEHELAGVLAHELSHVRNNDLLLFRFAELLRQTTLLMSRLGWILLFFALPIYLATGVSFPLSLFAILLGSPIVSAILQLALFRTREFSADLGAVELTRDPRALASALRKIDRPSGGLLSLLVPLPRREPSPLLRTHPATEERVRRLLALSR